MAAIEYGGFRDMEATAASVLARCGRSTESHGGGRAGEKRPLISSRIGRVDRPLLASFLASVMSFASGTVVAGWTAPQTPVAAGETLFTTKSMEQSSWIVSIYVIGAMLGAIPAGHISQTVGRKKLLLLLAIPMALGWLCIMFFVNDVYVIYAGRLLCGLSLGAVTVAVPLYNHEIAPDACRGRGGVFLDFMLCAGVLYSYAISSVVGLRVFSFTCALIPVAFCALFRTMPESPRYLYGRGRYADAESALRWLRGENFDVNSEFERFARLQNENDNEESDGGRSSTKNNSPETRRTFAKAVVVSLALATAQRMSGAGAIVQFTATLFKISGSSVEPITASIITGVFQLVGSAVACGLVDRVGRRKLLLVSSFAVVHCLTVLTMYFYYLNKGTLGDSYKVLPVVVVCAFIAFFRLGLGPIPWFMTGELLGCVDRNNLAQSCVASYSWMLSFVVMQSFFPLVDAWPVGLWLGYSAFSAVGMLFVLFFVPETSNKSADEIRASLAKTCQVG